MKEKGLRSKIEEYFKKIEEMDGITGKELKEKEKLLSVLVTYL